MEVYIGTILPWPVMSHGGAAPQDFALCNGAKLPIVQYQALFSLLGTTYGGDGRATFAVPDLRGRMILGVNDFYRLGSTGGTAENTISIANIPPHSHTAVSTTGSGGTVSFTIKAKNTNGNTGTPSSSAYLAIPNTTGRSSYLYNDNSTVAADAAVAGGSLDVSTISVNTQIGNTGNGAPIDNMPPYLAMNYIICVNGIYPTYD